MSLEKLIAAANTRLKNQNLKIKIEKRGSTLCLRGHFPSKINETELERQRISLGFTASLVGLQLAEAEALKIATSVNTGNFSWSAYLEKDEKIKTTGEWVEEFKENYFNRRAKNEKSELTWKKDYLVTFKKLDWDKPLTSNSIEKAILQTSPDTRVRQRVCMSLGALAKFAKIDIDTSQWSGSYSYKKAKPRDIPDDKIISNTIKLIEDKNWQWVIAMLATYGLRNHEVFLIDFDSLSQGEVIIKINSGKTGFRRVCPIYPEWFYEFDLKTIKLPLVNLKRANDKLGASVSQTFRRFRLPFKPYDLRHAWAIRSLLFGLDVSLAAQMMGHSLKVHTDTYQHWISEQHYKQAFKSLVGREKRPLPPK